jgi:hypothetical protein
MDNKTKDVIFLLGCFIILICFTMISCTPNYDRKEMLTELERYERAQENFFKEDRL